jgi:hypothetical protein
MMCSYRKEGFTAMRRYDYLTIGMLCLALALLALSGIARAETTIYATVTGEGAGYDTGYGVSVEHTTAQWNHLALHATGKAAMRKKYNASEGYTYGAVAQVRGYLPDKPFYLGVGYGVSGYRSEFSDGRVWEKSAWQPHVSVGYDADLFDLGATYYFEESDTPNKVEAVSLSAAVKVWRQMKIKGELMRMEFWQSGVREHDLILTVGFGWEF